MKKTMLAVLSAAMMVTTGTAMASPQDAGTRECYEPRQETSYACGGYHGGWHGHRGGYGHGGEYSYGDNEN